MCFIGSEAAEESICQSSRLSDINLTIPISWDGHYLNQVCPSTKLKHFLLKHLSFITWITVWDPFGLAGRWVYFSSVPLPTSIPWWGFILTWQTSDCKGSTASSTLVRATVRQSHHKVLLNCFIPLSLPAQGKRCCPARTGVMLLPHFTKVQSVILPSFGQKSGSSGRCSNGSSST